MGWTPGPSGTQTEEPNVSYFPGVTGNAFDFSNEVMIISRTANPSGPINNPILLAAEQDFTISPAQCVFAGSSVAGSSTNVLVMACPTSSGTAGVFVDGTGAPVNHGAGNNHFQISQAEDQIFDIAYKTPVGGDALDYNSDGDPDLVIATTSGVYAFDGAPSGAAAFSSRVQFATSTSPVFMVEIARFEAAGGAPFDGDILYGSADDFAGMLFSDSPSPLYPGPYPNAGDKTVIDPSSAPALVASSGVFTAGGDVNNDGNRDVIVATTTGLHWFENPTSPFASAYTKNDLTVPAGVSLGKFVALDLNGDSFLELFAPDTGNGVIQYFGATGAGVWAAATALPSSSVSTHAASLLVVGADTTAANDVMYVPRTVGGTFTVWLEAGGSGTLATTPVLPVCSSVGPFGAQGCLSGCFLPPTGGAITIVGQNFTSGNITLTANGVTVPLSTLPGNDTVFTYTAPSGLSTGPLQMVLTQQETGNTQSLNELVFVDPAADPTVDCIQIGKWFVNGNCRDCPEGGFCPGGSRVWPIQGYWSFDELVEPGQCEVASACCGALGESPACPVRAATDGGRDTQRCDEQLGYTGEFCATCVTPNYYRDSNKCLPCDPEDDGEFALLVIVFLALMTIIAVGVAGFTVGHVSTVVSGLLALQQLVYGGRMASSHLTSETGQRLADVFRALSFLTFDIEFIKPSCFVSQAFTFTDIFWGTLILGAIAMVLFAFASALYAAFLYKVTIKTILPCLFSQKSPEEELEDKEDFLKDLDDEVILEGIEDDDDPNGVGNNTTVVTDGKVEVEEQEEEYVYSSSASTSASSPVYSYSNSYPDPTYPAAAAAAAAGPAGGAGASGPIVIDEDKLTLAVGDPEDVPEVTFWNRMLTRVQLAGIILLVVMYFQIALRCLQGVYCVDVNGEDRLKVELTTLCYEGEHKMAAIVIWVLLAVYVVGFPVSMGIIMARAYLQGNVVALRTGQYGFLTRGLKLRYFWFRILSLGITLAIVTQSVLFEEPTAKLFVLALSMLINTLLVAALWPFRAVHNNVIQMVVGLLSGLQGVLFLDAESFDGDDRTSLRNALAIILAVSLLLVIGATIWHLKRQRKKELEEEILWGEVVVVNLNPKPVPGMVAADRYAVTSSSVSSSISYSDSSTSQSQQSGFDQSFSQFGPAADSFTSESGDSSSGSGSGSGSGTGSGTGSGSASGSGSGSGSGSFSSLMSGNSSSSASVSF